MRLHRDAKAELIRSIPLFADCTPAEVSEVAAIADEIDLREGRELTTENADGREFVVMIEGNADVGQGGRVINTLGAGDWFGEIALLTGKPRTATVTATSDVHALVIAGHRFTQLMEHAPGIREKVERVFALRGGED
jgi:CRP/FNR family cyclic AMP-dependent transcriptional regulator